MTSISLDDRSDLKEMLREDLFEEFHLRAPVPLDDYKLCSHLTFDTSAIGSERVEAAMHTICAALKAEPPSSGIRQFQTQNDGVAFKWQKHTEICALTVYSAQIESSDSYETTALDRLPNKQELLGLAGRLSAVHVYVQSASKLLSLDEEATPPKPVFPTERIAGGRVCDGRADIWSDFQLDAEGFTRLVIEDRGLGPRRSGRLLQRLLDIETYRIVSMLGLRVAHDCNALAERIETELHELLEDASFHSTDMPDRSLLDGLLRLATSVEHSLSRSSFRFAATAAYSKLVNRRLNELNEQRIQGAQRFAVFLRQRYLPAIETCEAARARLRDLAARIDRDASLIRTRIDLTRQEQNNDLLTAMNRRADQQFRLQHTVEALSSVAISYYAIGIIGVFCKAVAANVPFIDSTTLTAVLAPFIILSVVVFLRRVRRETLGSK